MSIQHVGAVLTAMPELDRLTAFVLVAVADAADRDTGWAFATVEGMARAARSSRRAAFYALKRLADGGYLRIVGKAGRASKYRVLFDYHGQRRPEAELYPPVPRGTRATGARGSQPTRAPIARGGAPIARGSANESAPPNNPPIGVSVSSPGITRSDVQKHARPELKKMPQPDETARERADRIAAAKRAQLAALAALKPAEASS